jgi:hypothetical protein
LTICIKILPNEERYINSMNGYLVVSRGEAVSKGEIEFPVTY